jgi:hypothetical protein
MIQLETLSYQLLFYFCHPERSVTIAQRSRFDLVSVLLPHPLAPDDNLKSM